MKNSIWQKRIPTLLGLTMIVIGIAITTYLANNRVIYIGRASSSEIPQNIRITNVSDNSFSVSYTTQEPITGTIAYGTSEKPDNTVYDDKDKKGEILNPYKIHYFTARNLNPSTKYLFSITSGNNTYLDNDSYYQVTTGILIDKEPPEHDPAAGKVIKNDSSPLEEGLIYLTANDAQTISTPIKTDGSFILPLNSLRNKSLDSYVDLKEDELLNILVLNSTQQSNVTLFARQVKPVPVITLSQDYDFTLSFNPVSLPSSLSFPTFQASPASNIKIISPKKGETYTDQKPVFKGTASPDTEVKIIIHSDEAIQTQILADKNGQWVYRPPDNLSPGEHTLSVTTRSPSGILQTITQSFTVFAQGNQVSESATPSASPTTTLTPTSSPTKTPVPTESLTPTPTQTIPTPTSIPSNSPTPTTVTPLPTTAPGSSSGLILGISALTTTSIGILLFLLSRGGAASL